MKLNQIATLGALSTLALNVQAQNKQPNIIIINADDLGYGDVSCNGATAVATPNVDRIAGDGIRLTNFHTTSATSTPSRFSLLTGKYAWRVKGTGVAPGDAAMIVTPQMQTLPDMMKRAGYTTGAIGKWHLGLGAERGKQNWNGEITPGLKDIGFDYSYIMAATGDRVPCVYIENGRVDNLDPNDPIEVSYAKPFEGEPTGKKNPEMLKMHPS
ncbi:MAG: sulfatase-like hydrolase/transferase, partial [Bacteroidales bacterium]